MHCLIDITMYTNTALHVAVQNKYVHVVDEFDGSNK